ncbi:MAG: UDP-N-acetylenolpyruvoylglucosamine reductase [Candidatus Scalindua sp.]|nr:UDP-N-acetylmuramate dehydrogenase [Planctomycetota bacterium]GJQ57291.1 MAG: UDP-N-acetylenolpyruvoylglucosamine reductase [Candidatus Scalindua sp.]
MITRTKTGDSIFQYDISLRKYTSFKTGGIAEIFVEPKSVSELREVLRFCMREQKKIFVLGNGTNILIQDDGVKGVVISMGGACFKEIKRYGMYVSSGAGVSLVELMRRVATWGLGGLSSLAGIPGSVGGAVMMNAGGKYGSISETIHSVTTVSFHGEIKKFSRKEIDFPYRGCSLREEIVLEVELLLRESHKERTFKEMNTIYREKREKQPFGTLNAGCIFKNPQGFKAAELIDKAGLKGVKVGGAIVSEKHANFIINSEGATSNDILDLIKMIQNSVLEKYNVMLETELHFW